MPYIDKFPVADARRTAVREACHADETACAEALIEAAQVPADARARIFENACRLVEGARAYKHRMGSLDAFLQEYALTSREGVVLMCLAEALLRIPDAETADRFIRDKVTTADWRKHLGNSDSILVNASTWGLMLTGRVIGWGAGEEDLAGVLGRLIARSGEPVIRQSMVQSMRILGRQFVMGRTIDEAISRADDADNRGYRHSYDMLGEAAHTAADAKRYFDAYREAIAAIGAKRGDGPIEAAPGVSVKLSALHPRYEFGQRQRVMAELVPRLKVLAVQSRDAGIGFAIDAEEADRLDLSLDVIEAVYGDPDLDGWEGFGVVVQAYLKRAIHVIDWLGELVGRHRRRMMVRLVKGAYWDSEIKWAQEQALNGYPVFTRKVTTDVSYIACAGRLLAASDLFYPQFATHNAHTAAAVIELAGDKPFEFQRLHGMGEPIFSQIVNGGGVACRVYAPVGRHEDLLPYLVRRLLENGANTSFVNRMSDAAAPVEDIVADPIDLLTRIEPKPHPEISLPIHTVGAARVAGRGLDLTDPMELAPLATAMEDAEGKDWRASAVIGGKEASGRGRDICDPADRRRVVGQAIEANGTAVGKAVGRAAAVAADWDAAGGEFRASCLEAAADLYEANAAALMMLCVREAGKTLGDATAEVREAVDFCRYYAERARIDFIAPEDLPGPTGERNELMLHGRGVFACISPWNFPLAIFTGQITAALAAGNAVVAKPAEQTPLIAAFAVRLLHEAGVPVDVLQFVPGSGATVGAALVGDGRIDGVAFTGSTEVAQSINRTLASRSGPIVPLVAETGGQNVMIVDSSALPEQVVTDVIRSAFHSAGQRCSALRVLFLQDDVAPRILEMLTGAMEELRVGDPAMLSTDVGPVIDDDARRMLEAHAERMGREGTLLYRTPLPGDAEHGTFFAPVAFEIDGLERLEREVFGPILHVIRYPAKRLDAVLEAVRNTHYGLTLGIHSRIDETIRHIHSAMPVGNVYVNRNMVGAIVGVQPFGGEGLSGTGPKAGGPHYLHRFAVERTLSVNIVAMGGNTQLLSLAEDVPA